MVRPHGHGSRVSRVRSRVRYLRTGNASFVGAVRTSSPTSPSGKGSPVSMSTTSGMKWSSQTCIPSEWPHSEATPGPIISERPYVSQTVIPIRTWILSRILSVIGSAPTNATRSGREWRSTPSVAATSARRRAYEGVAPSTVAPKSRISITWRTVFPTDVGTTVAPDPARRLVETESPP